MARLKCRFCGADMEAARIYSTYALMRCSNVNCPSRQNKE